MDKFSIVFVCKISTNKLNIRLKYHYFTIYFLLEAKYHFWTNDSKALQYAVLLLAHRYIIVNVTFCISNNRETLIYPIFMLKQSISSTLSICYNFLSFQFNIWNLALYVTLWRLIWLNMRIFNVPRAHWAINRTVHIEP